MRPIHRRDIIRGARELWLDQYSDYPDDRVVGWDHSRTAGSIRAALKALNLETCAPADLDAALGVSVSWAKNECDECGADCEVVLSFGEEPDNDARWWDLCLDCLGKARDLLASQPPHSQGSQIVAPEQVSGSSTARKASVADPLSEGVIAREQKIWCDYSHESGCTCGAHEPGCKCGAHESTSQILHPARAEDRA